MSLRWMQTPILAISLILTSFSLTSCAGKSRAEQINEALEKTRPHGSAYAVDGFTLDNRNPEPRPVQVWEFYYKECALVSRNPYPNKTEYSCQDPH